MEGWKICLNWIARGLEMIQPKGLVVPLSDWDRGPSICFVWDLQHIHWVPRFQKIQSTSWRFPLHRTYRPLLACQTVCHKLTTPHPHSPTFFILSSHDIKSNDLMTHSDALTDYVVKHDPCQGSTDPLITLQNIFHPFWSSSCLAWSRLGYHHLSSHKPISFYLS